MCGITGLISFTENGKKLFSKSEQAVSCLKLRGPDAEGSFQYKNVFLGHRRLSIIDLSNAGAQPMTDASGRFTIIFNGEFFNFKQYREFVKSKGFTLKSNSDTEVLLYLYILEKEKCLERINGFFSLAIYDKEEQELFLARDRYGVKPMLWYQDADCFAFASEMKSLLQYGLTLSLDYSSLFSYLQLNYIQPPFSLFKEVRKLQPGHFIKIRTDKQSDVEETCWYSIPEQPDTFPDYESAKKQIEKLMDEAVQRRLISDVPLGSFLSGGIDSSITTALAARHTKHLKTFSIGFRDEPHFDETEFAKAVAEMHQTDHTVFSLTNEDLYEILFDALNYIDEPFADSSALNVYLLSKHTRKEVTVALSGDGADELFGGYNKHRAEWLIRNHGALTSTLKLISPVTSAFAGSRQSKLGNFFRQIHRFAEGADMTAQQRYWRWCCLASEKDAKHLISGLSSSAIAEAESRIKSVTGIIKGGRDMNDIFRADFKLVLAGDMLVKVDMMSMANSLEVRNPFLDVDLVNYVFNLPSHYKIDKSSQKKILRETFTHLLPEKIKKRGKKGFEVPLLKWFRSGLKSKIENDWLNENFIREQGIFNADEIRKLMQQLNSSNPGESVARIWALIVFQHWWKKYGAGLRQTGL